jgi:hypothetical protein
MKLMAKFRNEYFRLGGSDLALTTPDLGYQHAISNLACAILCCQMNCSRFGSLSNGTGLICQMSQKKGSCMDKDETFSYPGSQIYQKKVLLNVYYMTFHHSFDII